MARLAVQLAGEIHLMELVARLVERIERARKDHAPRQIRVPAPQLAADEVAEASEPEPDRHQRCDEIDDIEKIELVAPRPEQRRGEHAEQPAVERHAAFPDAEQARRMMDQLAGIVENHVADAAAEDHAEHRVEREIGKLIGRDRQASGRATPLSEPPGRGETDEIHDAVPVHLHRAERDGDRIDVDEIVGHEKLPLADGALCPVRENPPTFSSRQDPADEALEIFRLGNRRMHRMIRTLLQRDERLGLAIEMPCALLHGFQQSCAWHVI